ncbi:nucleoporin Gle1-like [Portunus trituberculatus]|uniref:nucleoporin Gle1-like n=1 Tax=Portunus trituberculatus TaxID=210409 RepID=UPI001E1D1764|nr:nucleoporin Gle1-like [Portunus trituberculatus]
MEDYFNVINALKNSKRLRHWDKPPEDYGPSNPEDSDYNRNGLKDVGDLSKVDFSRQFSFTTEVETKKECQEENKDEVPTDFQHSFCSAEEPSECDQLYVPTSLDIARKAFEQYKLNLLLEKLSLEKSYKEAIQRKTQQKQEAYLQCLNTIYAQHEKEVEKHHLVQQEKIKHEENLLRQQEEEAQTAVQRCKKEYTSQVSRQSSQLLEAVESARRQEAEQANLVQSLIAQLQASHVDFVAKQDVMYRLLKELEGSEINFLLFIFCNPLGDLLFCRLANLKQKVDNFIEAPERLSKEQQWEVRRKATMANQINKDNHSINRDKLQKLLTEMRERKGEPDVLASFKNSVMSNIVKQVALQDALGASAYSWLLVELITFHPDLWDLFLYHLFKVCPPLMPGSQMGREGQISIEKLDQYYSQIGKYSTMYGFVLTRINKKQGSPIRAAAMGWEVVANVLSQPPLSGISGEVLLRFIQSFGFTLQETYRKQFVKLMEFIIKCYMPKIKEATEEGGQNCVILFENFLAEYKPNKVTQNPMIMKYM